MMEQQNPEIQKCDHCLKFLQSAKMGTHYGYCARNFIRCLKCGAMYDKNLKDEHEEQFHKKYKCQMCQGQFLKDSFEQHKKKCDFKPQQCMYCDLNVPLRQFDDHILMCESRTTKCEICEKDVANKIYFDHVTTCLGPEKVIFHEQNLRRNNFSQLDGSGMFYIPPQTRKRAKKETQLNRQSNKSTKMSTRQLFDNGTQRTNRRNNTVKAKASKLVSSVIDLDVQENQHLQQTKVDKKNKKNVVNTGEKMTRATHKKIQKQKASKSSQKLEEDSSLVQILQQKDPEQKRPQLREVNQNANQNVNQKVLKESEEIIDTTSKQVQNDCTIGDIIGQNKK